MSQDFLDPELITDFILESKEHLETIEPNLLELEKEPDNLALLNEIFRPMHSLKGASGFLALNRINQLAHKSENILDELRKGTMTASVCSDNFTALNFLAFCVINFKLFCVSKMLKDFSIFICYRYFHNMPPLFINYYRYSVWNNSYFIVVFIYNGLGLFHCLIH